MSSFNGDSSRPPREDIFQWFINGNSWHFENSFGTQIEVTRQ